MSRQEPVFLEDYYEPLDAWFENAIYPSESGVSVYFRDITERKERERQLREYERRYRTIIENFPNGAVALVDRDGLEQYTENTLSDRSDLIDELQRVRDRGVAFEVREFLPDESGVAVPLRRGDETVGALELALPLTRIPDPRCDSKAERFPDELVDRVREAARSIEDRLEN
jgi:PAS domain-containing protein